MFGLGEWNALTTGLLAGVVSLILVKIWQTYHYLNTFKRMGINGPGPLPLVGNTLPISKLPFSDIFRKWEKEYGEVYGIFFPMPTLIVSDMDLIREILIKKFSSFTNKTDFLLLSSDESTKDSLLSLKGDHWKHVRGQLSPTFSSTKLKQMVPAIERVAKNLLKCLTDKAAKGEEIELKNLLKTVTMDVIAGVAFGHEVDSLRSTSDPFYQHGNSLVTSANKRVPLFVLFPLLTTILTWLSITPFPKADTSYLVSVINSALKERQLDTQVHNDFLQLLVDAQKAAAEQEQVDSEIDFKQQLRTSDTWTRKGLTLSEMHANAIIFLFAGYDAVAVVMSMTLFALAANPHCLRKAQEEVDNKIGNNTITYAAAMSLSYIDMCMNETMRLFLPGFLDRNASEDVEIAGYHLKKGFRVGIPTGVIHHDPQLWPDPFTFDPERFTAEARATRHPLAFIPFGLGPRNCIGMRLAQVEIRVILASILHKFTPVLCDKSVYPPNFLPMSTNARDGLWVKLEVRQDVR